MDKLSRRIADLPPEKQALLAMRLQRQREQPQRSITTRLDLTNHPLSYAQERLWFLDQFQPESPVYNIPAALRIHGPLQIDALQRSITAIAQRHEPLRATISAEHGRPVQSIPAHFDTAIAIHDLQHLQADKRETEVMRLAQEEGQRPFHLQEGPLLRATLLKLGAHEHVLLLTVHHIAFDGWSTTVFLRELAALYHQFAQGVPAELPELPISYADFAAWQRSWLQSEALQQQLAYWLETLQDAPHILDLPTDHPRPPVLSHKGSHVRFTIPQSLVEAVRGLAGKHDATFFMTTLAAFQVLLYRYSRQEAITVGIPVAQRQQRETQDLIGLFVNSLVIRSALDSAASFSSILQQVRERSLQAYANQDVPFELLVERLKPERDMSRSPLFQVMFEMQEMPLDAVQVDDLRLELMELETGVAKFDLLFSLVNGRDRVEGLIEYRSDLFEEATIQRMAQHYLKLLTGIVSDPQQTIGSYPLLTTAERQTLLQTWNDTAVAFPSDALLQHGFEQQAGATPDRVAVVAPHQGKQLTYAQLNHRANQLAHHLQALGVGPDQLVGVCLHRSLEMVVAVLGILKAGGAYVPLDPGYPRDRLDLMISDSGMQILLTDSTLLDRLLAFDGKMIAIDEPARNYGQEAGDTPPCAATAENLAYVIYTSGSTGQPKGAMIPHRAISNHMAWMQADLPLVAADRVLQKTPFSFDASVWEFYAPLNCGGRLVMAPPGAHADPAELVALVQQQEITILQLVPTLLRAILAEQEDAFARCHTLRRLFCGGETLSGDLVERCEALLEAEIFNLYGPSEAAIDTTYWRCNGGQQGPVPIGRPIANTRLYVLDPEDQLVPIGIPGELVIGGCGVGRGYWRRPELTAAQFVAEPFTGNTDQRAYRTGDLVKYRTDGALLFLGRNDHQIKLRGFRIELGEITACLARHPGIREATVTLQQHPDLGDQLVAYYVADGDKEPQAAALRAALSAQLPKHMVPTLLMSLDALPLLPNGKVATKQLPAPNWHERQTQTAVVLPRTPTEMLLAGIFSRILDQPEVSVQDSFFELGGHSLLATRIMARVRDAFGVDLPLQTLFESPTVANLAQRIEAATASASQVPAGRISKLARGVERPLSFAQQRLWFNHHLEPQSALYHIAQAIRLRGPLDVDLLEASLNAVVARHETLRSTFATVAGQPVLQLHERWPINLNRVDLQTLSSAEQTAALQTIGREIARRPFDLAAGPLLRATVATLGDDHAVLLVCMHHIVSDGWSTEILVRETSAQYHAAATGAEPDLPQLPLQYSDYAHWQRQQIDQGALEGQLAYWAGQLAELPDRLDLPTDRPRPAEPAYRGARLPIHFSPELSKKLQTISQEENVTLFMTLLAVLQVLLMRHSGQDDIAVGVPVANRNRTETEGLIGFLVNTLTMRSRLNRGISFRALLKAVRCTALQAYENQDVPFDLVVNRLQPQRKLNQHPLFQVFFAWQNAPAATMKLPGLTLETMDLDAGTATMDLTLVLNKNGPAGGISGYWEYDRDLFDQSTIERLAGHFETLLQGAVADPGQTIGRLPLLTATELQTLLVDWNDTAVPFPDQTTAHALFEEQVRRTPHGVAVHFEDTRLTYDQLNRRANRLAHLMRRRGAGAGASVAVALERSPDLIVTLLAIMKAGAAYLPLDPAYPQERLAFMLADSQAMLLVTYGAAGFDPAVGSDGAVLDLAVLQEGLSWEPDTNLAAETGPDDLAYVIYTSGSTGEPKGTLLCHGGLCNLAVAYIRRQHIGPGSRVLQFFPSSFDASLGGIFAALLSGGTLVMAPAEKLLPGPNLVALLREHRITHAALTPSALAAVPESPLPDLQVVETGGEVCPPDLVARWLPGRRFFNAYGPTETTVVTTWFEVDAKGNLPEKLPIGRPLPNVKLYIVDDQLQPVPVGVAGELLIGGVGVAKGYANRPALTAEKFIDNPFDPDAADQLYRSGDRVRYSPTGQIEFLGRIDEQVKVRGFRIEPGEIAAKLEQHPAIQRALVMARDDQRGVPQLVAYLVQEPDHPVLKIPDLHTYLKQHLPLHMVPSHFIPLQDLPLLPSGKVDRQALPEPQLERDQLATRYIPPGTEEELALAAVWQNLLGLQSVGIQDNFFELGGDSIMIIQMVSRARQAGLHLEAKEVFQYPTIAELARVARQATAVAAEQGPVSGPLPLTPIQAWYLEQPNPDRHHWNQAVLFESTEALESELVDQALQALIDHHDALRLRFTREDGTWRQENDPPGCVASCVVHALHDKSDRAREKAIAQHAQALQQSMRLAEPPLLRAALFQCGGDEPDLLLVAIHHLVIDTVSWRILAEDFERVYGQLQANQPARLPAKTTSYRAWAKGLIDLAASETILVQRPNWARLSQHRPFTFLPADNENGSLNREDSVVTLVTTVDTKALAEAEAQHDATVQELLLAAVAQTISAWSGLPGLLVDLEGHGRGAAVPGADVSRTAGWFTALYPVFIDLAMPNGTASSVIRATKEALRAVPAGGSGFGLLRYLHPDEDVRQQMASLPKPQVSFNYLGHLDNGSGKLLRISSQQHLTGPERSSRALRSHLLDISGSVRNGRLTMEWRYCSAIHQAETIAGLACGFAQAIQAFSTPETITATERYSPSDFPEVGLSNTELQQLLSRMED